METVKINMVPKGAVKAAHASQGDAPRVVRFELFDELLPYTLDGSEDITLTVVRPDTEEIVSPVNNTEEAYIDVSFTSEMTAIRGVANCEIKITKSGAEIGSHNFDLNIERGAYGEDITVETASGVIATFTTGVIDNLVGLKTTFEPKQDLHGYNRPWPAGAGKNKFPNSSTFPYNSTVLDTYYAEFSPNVNERKIPIIHLEPNVTYTLSMFVTASKTPFSISVGIGDGRYLSDIITVSGLLGNTRCSATFTVTPEQIAQGDVLAFKAPRYSERGDFTCLVSDVMLEIGSSATDYEPYENICEITGIDEINLFHTGVNLFDEEYPSLDNTVRYKQIYVGNGTFTMSSTAPVVEGACLLFFLAGNVSSGTSTSNNGVSINQSRTVTTDDGYITVGYRYYGNPTYYPTDYKTQIEKGSQATEYQAYDGESALVEIGQTVYGGYYDKDLGIVLTKKAVDLGSLDWIYSDNGFFQTVNEISDIKPVTVAYIANMICEILETKQAYNVYTTGEGIGVDGKRLRAMYKNAPTDPAKFKSAVSGYKVCYELETPIIIPADAVNFETVRGVNNVWSDTNGETEVKFYVKEA